MVDHETLANVRDFRDDGRKTESKIHFVLDMRSSECCQHWQRGVDNKKRVLSECNREAIMCHRPTNSYGFTIIMIVDRKSRNMMYISYRCNFEYVSNHI